MAPQTGTYTQHETDALRVMIVDDSRSMLAWMRHSLEETADYQIDTCEAPLEALARSEEAQYDLFVIDYLMPDLTGIELTQRLRERNGYRTVPIVMVTSEEDREIRLASIRAGATDFLNKPFEPIELQARIKNLLTLRRAQKELAVYASGLASAVEQAAGDIIRREEEIIWRLALAIETRDGGTGEHVSRVAAICRLLAEGLGLDEELCRMIYLAAPLHDVGKIGISDAVLGKPGRLTADEMAEMRRHVEIGLRILDNGSSRLVRTASAIVGGHHERWDGTGYPAGLAGHAIPVEARIAAIADVFDALCSERPYKRAWTLEEAYQEIIANAGSHFDPTCVEVFRRRWPAIVAVIRSGDDPASETIVPPSPLSGDLEPNL